MMNPEHIIPLGTLVAIGGNEDKTADMKVLRAIFALARTPVKIVEVIPTASRIPDEAAGQYVEPFTKLGATKVNIMDIEDREQANDPELVARIIAADLVYFTGGDQLRLTNLLGGSELLNTLKGHYQRGGIIAGTSAGAAAMSQAMIYQGKAGHGMRKGNVQMTPGLGLMRNVVVDSHFTQRGRFSRLLEVVTGNPGVIGIGLDEDSAAIIRDGNRIEAIGTGAVIVIDGHGMKYSNITQVRMGQAIAEEGILVHTLTRGHQYHLDERRYIRPADVIPEEDAEDDDIA